MSESSETTVCVTKSKSLAENLRKEIIYKFERVWVYVYNYNNTSWEVKIANAFGGKLDKLSIVEIDTFSRNFIKGNDKDESAEDLDIDEARPENKA